uniref:E3 ubiquitin-protein ligase RNF4 n=1 Tax=Pipistrellus kuhlii TaxID=59472 RepID=A0A7J7RW61_PIPKU|nr:ring finger protein 4 [Pipistrellus kuhlii]
MSTRKRRGGAVSSRQAQKRAREAASAPGMALEAEPIELVESAGDEIVDLTCESLEPVVVDLTHNDSVVIVDGERFRFRWVGWTADKASGRHRSDAVFRLAVRRGQAPSLACALVGMGFSWRDTGPPRAGGTAGVDRSLGLRLAFPWLEVGGGRGGPCPECGPLSERRRPRRNARRQRQDHADSCVVSSDDEELSRDRDVYVTTHTPRNAREETSPGLRPSGTVSCPICMDGYAEIVQNGRVIVSTECGHVFCSQCLRDSLKNANTCPTCRKKMSHKRYHPIYI